MCRYSARSAVDILPPQHDATTGWKSHVTCDMSQVIATAKRTCRYYQQVTPANSHCLLFGRLERLIDPFCDLLGLTTIEVQYTQAPEGYQPEVFYLIARNLSSAVCRCC